MATFSKVWAIKSDHKLDPGTVIQVALKRGGTKPVELGAFLYEKGDAYYYASPLKIKEED